jgi:hypothetical protein
MSFTKLLAGLTALALGAAVVTALAGVGPEEKAGPTPAVATADRPGGSVSIPACSPEPWPYGCQWRVAPAKRNARTTRSF